jgi:hypothetical protein
MSLQKWLIKSKTNKFVTCAIFSKTEKKVYIIEHDRPRCHNVVVDLVCSIINVLIGDSNY